MNTTRPKLITLITLLIPLALFSSHANTEPETSSATAVNHIVIKQIAAAPAQAEQLFDEAELAKLAELEAENQALQEQKAGFFGPRIGTIIIIGVALVLLL